MRRLFMFTLIITASISMLTACNIPLNGGIQKPGSMPTQPDEDTTAYPMVSPPATGIPETEQPTPTAVPVQELSFSPAFYLDEDAGIEFAYPVGWTVTPREQIGERGAQAALLSPGSTIERVAAGGARIILTTYTWDPKNDLDAYISQRKIAWEASGFKVLAQEEYTLEDYRKVVTFTVENMEGNEGLFTFLTSGEDYLHLFGDGDLSLCKEILSSLRTSK